MEGEKIFNDFLKNGKNERFCRNNGMRSNYHCRGKRSKRGQAGRTNWVWCRGADEIFNDGAQEQANRAGHQAGKREFQPEQMRPVVFVHILWPKN